MRHILFVVVPKEPRISSEVFLKIADIFLNLGYLSAGSIVLPFIFERANEEYVIGGFIFAITSWLLALMIVQKYHG